MENSKVSSVKKLNQEIHSNAQKLETIARDLRRIMKSLNDIQSIEDRIQDLPVHPFFKGNDVGSHSSTKSPSPQALLDKDVTPSILQSPKDKTNLNCLDNDYSKYQARQGNEACFPGHSDTPFDRLAALISQNLRVSDSDDHEEISQHHANRDSGVSLNQQELEAINSSPKLPETEPVARNYDEILSLKDKSFHTDYFAWNPPKSTNPVTQERSDQRLQRSPTTETATPFDHLANEFTSVGISPKLTRAMETNTFSRPVLGTELNFISIFLMEMNKINRYVRKHYPETCVYSSKPRRVHDFMTAVSRNWTVSTAQVESLKREAPIFWEVFGTSLQNAQMIPNDFQISNPIIKEGVPITREHLRSLTKKSLGIRL